MPHLHATMPTLSRLTALALARAMLAGPQSPRGMAARLRDCLGLDRPWVRAIAEFGHALPAHLWQRLEPRSLAALIERLPAYREACAARDPAERPRARRYLLRPNERMGTRPLGLDAATLPTWPNLMALAQGLDLGGGALWRLTRPAAWQRRSPPGQRHYHPRLLAKRHGGWRLLEVPEPWLMGVQQRLLQRLLRHVPVHEAVHGHPGGPSVVDHAQAHAGQPVVMRFDLQDFFGHVRASRVHALFATLGYPCAVAQAMTALCTTATPEPVLQRLRAEGGWTWQQARHLRDGHLPQGAPSSPALANLCAFRLDLRLDGLAHALGARYTRYADDLVFSGDASLAAARARVETWVGRIALEEGFALNHRKTRCLYQGQRQTVCHVVVNARTNLSRDDFDRLKAILHRCATEGPASQNREGHPRWREHLEGRVAWAAQLNPPKAQRLRRWLDRIDWTR